MLNAIVVSYFTFDGMIFKMGIKLLLVFPIHAVAKPAWQFSHAMQIFLCL